MQYLFYCGAVYVQADQYQDIGFTETGRWGNQGSGILFTTGAKILLLKRSPYVEEPGTWGIPGGAVPQAHDSTFMHPYESAKKEVLEELGSVLPHKVVDRYVYQESGFRYTTYIAKVRSSVVNSFHPVFNWENVSADWFTRQDVLGLDLHFGVEYLLQHSDPFDL